MAAPRRLFRLPLGGARGAEAEMIEEIDAYIALGVDYYRASVCFVRLTGAINSLEHRRGGFPTARARTDRSAGVASNRWRRAAL